jgi:uncharacterized protein
MICWREVMGMQTQARGCGNRPDSKVGGLVPMKTNLIFHVIRGSLLIGLAIALAAPPGISLAQCWDFDFLLAIRKGDAEKVKHLLKRGVDANATCGEFAGFTPLMWAVWHGNAGLVKLLLNKGADVNANGGRDLIYAASQGRSDIMRLLLAKGSDLNAKDSEGRTALMYAARNGRVSAVKLLLAGKADLDAGDKDQRTALTYATSNGRLRVVRLLRARRAKSTLEFAARVGDYQGIQRLLREGANVNAKNKDGTPVVVWAAANGDGHVVKMLLEKGARVDAKDKHGWTSLMWAASNDDTEMVDLLKIHGAKANGFAEVTFKTLKGEVLESSPANLSIRVSDEDATEVREVKVGLRTRFIPFRRPEEGEWVEVRYRSLNGSPVGQEVRISP